MSKEVRYWIHTITPLHLGAGRGLDFIDLPIVRERVTNWPYIPGSSVKGVISDYFANAAEIDDEQFQKAFGRVKVKKDDEQTKNAGALCYTDAQLLCLPVRSFYGTFAWVTTPFCVQRFNRNVTNGKKYPNVTLKKSANVSNTSKLLGSDSKLYLEELDLDAVKDAAKDDDVSKLAAAIAKDVFPGNTDWQDIFKERFAVINEEIFTYLNENATEVNAHICIDPNTGTVKDGGLWYQEELPVETILSGTVWTVRTRDEALLDEFCTKNLTVQIGGKASTGRGVAKVLFDAGK